MVKASCVDSVYPSTDSGPPDNPCPIRFRWRSVTHVRMSGHVDEYGGSDSEHARAAMVSEARSSSPRPSPQPSVRRRTGPCLVSDQIGPKYRK